MNGELFLQYGGGGALAAILVAVVYAFFGRKKMSAEATEYIQKAASGVVKDLRDQLDRERSEWAAERELAIRAQGERDAHIRRQDVRLANLEARDEAWRAVLQLHVAWDHLAVTKLRDLAVGIPDAPPLYPPQDTPARW